MWRGAVLLVALSGPANPGLGHCIVFLDKSTQLYKMGTGELSPGGNSKMD